MIPYHKDLTAGLSELTRRGSVQKKKDCTNYDGSPDAYRPCKKKFGSNRSIFASKEVKKMLYARPNTINAAYCEKRSFEPLLTLRLSTFDQNKASASRAD